MKRAIFSILLLLGALSNRLLAEQSASYPGLKSAAVMIIRHAEKPESGFQLSSAGEKRAHAYPAYFKNLVVDGQSLTPDYLIATADSSGSHRPRLTIEPLGKALGLKVHSSIKNKDFTELAHELEKTPHGHHILICWHHGEIPSLAESLGADPAKLLPKGKWPSEQFGWMLLLRYDAEGRLVESKCVHEKLMPGDD